MLSVLSFGRSSNVLDKKESKALIKTRNEKNMMEMSFSELLALQPEKQAVFLGESRRMGDKKVSDSVCRNCQKVIDERPQNKMCECTATHNCKSCYGKNNLCQKCNRQFLICHSLYV
eukprot:TRINITY_DN3872_c0_g1_i1.p1 TRINITY_DN3872_c0_g1~~TRINITY_DN3872_c0_g1_i1.p1  ORF type:complete len:117 (-),score=13.32 TRINITY_DN3872_c0_g1_i1:163-513(-)